MRLKLLHLVAGQPDAFSIEARILHGSCFAVGVAGVLAGLISIWPLGTGFAMVSACLGGGLIGFLGWYLGRIRKQFFIALLLFLFSQIMPLVMVFIYNGGINGPTPFFFATWVPVYIFILDAPLATIAVLLFFFTYSTLYFLQTHGFITPVSYINDRAHAFDLYGGYLFHFILTVIIAVCAKQAFQAAQRKIQASSEAKTQFLANISHEIRTPMNAILGMNELALAASMDPQQKLWLQTTQTAAQHLLSLMEDLLDISSIDEGRLSITPQPLHLQDFLKNLANIMRQFVANKTVTLDVDLARDLPEYIEADPLRLRQVLVNLLGNAIKFTNEGKVQLSVAAEKVAGDRMVLHFSIRDTGIGIAANDQEKIFDVFTQGENVDLFKHRGFGLGLSISRQLVEKMGGDIWLESHAGIGSTFYFTLPVSTVKRPAPLPAATRPDMAADIHMPILVVEDNLINLEVARHFLQKQAFHVHTAENGQQALDLLGKQKYALVLMDLEMPVLDGFESARRLRAGEAGLLNKYTPVLAITAHALKEHRDKCFATGMQGVITKPYSSETLLAEIAKVLQVSYP